MPAIWLVSDARNDARLEPALRRLPRGSAFVFRHYHLDPEARRARFDGLARIARARGHRVILAGSIAQARHWGADGAYGAPKRLQSGAQALRAVTAHSLREIARARAARADAIVLSPVFATRSHPGGGSLGPTIFRLLAARAGVPVIALGGMNPRRARTLGTAHWAAIDGIGRPAPKDS